MNTHQQVKYACDGCGQLIEVGRPRYVLKGELFCAWDGGTFDESGSVSSGDWKQEMQRLIQEAETRDEKDLQDEVHFPFELDLCPECRVRIYRFLAGNTPPPDA